MTEVFIDMARLNKVTISFLLTAAALTGFVTWAALSGVSKRVFLHEEPIDLVKKFGGTPVVEKETGIQFYRSLAKESRAVATTLFSRSGVYLISGVLTAVSGIGLFLVARAFSPVPEKNASMPVLEYGVILFQNAGILLISELIAFFFLRQSRSVLDEFRHADRIARQREEVLALLMVSDDDGGVIYNVKDIVEAGKFFSISDRLSNGDTTEILEARKAEKTEIDVLTKMIDLAAVLKR